MTFVTEYEKIVYKPLTGVLRFFKTKIWVSEFSDLQAMVQGDIYYKEHPLNRYVGREDSRTWMSGVKGEFPSFFAFWKKCKKEIF